MPDYMIRTMTRRNLDIAVRWAAAEGWNPGLHDADCFYATDPSGFLMGWLDGEPISAISVVKYGASFGFLGFYIVKPAFRERGYGFQIWQAGLNDLEGRTIGLDGVVAQQPNYLKSGFELAYRNIRYEGFGRDVTSQPPAIQTVPLSSLPLESIMAYDRPFFPDDRQTFLQAWINQPDSTALGIVENQTLLGYGVLRPCIQGYKVGPLFAENAEIAEALLNALVTKVEPGQPFYLDVPEVNPAAVAIAQKYGMTSMFETARMYSPTIPQLPIHKIFGVTTFELG
ncbi:GNAT family N-acetyltransferase [Vacuolonema iberomarrocanum]|uniref:GNAT family N-acetyltransferase n=1 Tax=Vacuolonema iberomarrocanum TaxID=3454632 RepID=UPI0019DF9053|nr:GNAT family N-acetyltransferase [filamentous cyanobacterium LEGE 07170]